MKVTKQKLAENRAALIRAAGELFRERGIDGVGVAEICQAAGLTHGALYAQFPSKAALAAEALADGLQRVRDRLNAPRETRSKAIGEHLDYLLSAKQRDNIARSCPITASASEIGRQDEATSERFAEGFEGMVAAIEASLGGTLAPDERRRRAIAIVVSEIGAIAMSRGALKARPGLSNEILTATRAILGEIAGEHIESPAAGRARPRAGARTPRGKRS